MKKNRQNLLLILLIIIVTIVSITIIRKIKNTPPKISNEKLDQRVPIEVFEVEKKVLIKSLNYTGLIKLDKEVMTSSRVGGLISKVYIDEGDRVEKGELLVVLDSKDYEIKFNISQNEKEDSEIKVEQAKLNLEDSVKKIRISSLDLDNLIIRKKELHYKYLEEKSNFKTQKANYQRDKTLYEKQALSKSAFENSENLFKNSEYQLKQIEAQEEGININLKKSKLEFDQAKIKNKLAEKNLKQAKTYLKKALNNLKDSMNQLEYTKIKAKENGVILNLFSESGEVVSVGQELIRYGVDDRVKITLGVGNKDIALMTEGMKAEFSIDSIPGKVYNSRINKIMPSVNSDSGLTLIEINLDNKEHIFKENMFTRIKLIIDKSEDALIVPKEFINTDNNNNKYLYVVKNEMVFTTIVTTGIESDAMVEITSGVNENDIVTSGNLSHLKDGSKILIWNDTKGGEENDVD